MVAYIYVLESKVLTTEDIDNIKMFSLRIDSKISRLASRKFRNAFQNKISLDTFYLMHRRISRIAGIIPERYDCCINTCCMFVGEKSDLSMCPFCQQARYNESGKARQHFDYLPLIPRLQGLFQNPEIVRLLAYRSEYTRDGNYSDIFDGDYYRDLCQTPLIIDGKDRNCYLFSGEYDLVFALLSDGIRIFKGGHKSSATATPFIIQLYSLPPEIRTHLQYLLPLGLAPGPHGVKDHNSFLEPFHSEMKKLAHGVQTFNCRTNNLFLLRGYLLVKIGDMIDIKSNQYLKGPNGFSPCRRCRIQGCCDPSHRQSHYYFPLTAPADAVRLDYSLAKDWDPYSLPLRTEQGFKKALKCITSAGTKKEQSRLQTVYGINGQSILVDLPGFSRIQSLPHDFMHLMFENIIPGLVELWSGRFKGLDEGDEDYQLPQKIWETIGEETAAASVTIPACFVSALPNIEGRDMVVLVALLGATSSERSSPRQVL